MAKTPYEIRHFLTPPSVQSSNFILSPDDSDKTQLIICNGVNPSWKVGSLLKDTGYFKLGSDMTAAKSIVGLHHFRQDPLQTTHKTLAALNNAGNTATDLYYNNAGTWTQIAGAVGAWTTPNTQVEMEDFIGYCFMVGANAAGTFLTSASLRGTTFSTTTDVSGMPGARYIQRYRDRLYIGNCYYSGTAYPYRVYFSSVPSAGTITWTPSTDFIDMDFNEQIVGISTNWDRLVCFTEFKTYYYDQNQKKEAFAIGCANNRTIRNYEGFMIWANKDNVWLSTGGRPDSIGDDILQLLWNSNNANWEASIVDREYHLYLGDTSANGIDYSNCLCTYNILTKMWRWRTLYDPVVSMTSITQNGDDWLILGNNNGQVMQKTKYIDPTPYWTDNGQPIVSHFRTKALDMGRRDVKKYLSKITFYAMRAQNLMMRFRIFDRNNEMDMPFSDIQELSDLINTYPDDTIEANFIQFEGKEISKLQGWEFNGMTMLFDLGADQT